MIFFFLKDLNVVEKEKEKEKKKDLDFMQSLWKSFSIEDKLII